MDLLSHIPPLLYFFSHTGLSHKRGASSAAGLRARGGSDTAGPDSQEAAPTLTAAGDGWDDADEGRTSSMSKV